MSQIPGCQHQPWAEGKAVLGFAAPVTSAPHWVPFPPCWSPALPSYAHRAAMLSPDSRKHLLLVSLHLSRLCRKSERLTETKSFTYTPSFHREGNWSQRSVSPDFTQRSEADWEGSLPGRLTPGLLCVYMFVCIYVYCVCMHTHVCACGCAGIIVCILSLISHSVIKTISAAKV